MFGFNKDSQKNTPDTAPYRNRYSSLTLELSPSVVIAAVVAFVVILAWVFIFGVIVGRGHNPVTNMPGSKYLLQNTQPSAKYDIIKPEELRFMDELKQPPPKPKQETTQTKTIPPQAIPPKHQPTKIQNGSAPVYDWVFQIASYKDGKRAEIQRGNLTSKGVRAFIAVDRDHTGKPRWYRVQTSLRGTELDTTELRTRMARLGIKELMLISKKTTD